MFTSTFSDVSTHKKRKVLEVSSNLQRKVKRDLPEGGKMFDKQYLEIIHPNTP